jgi:hypothetical protein
VVGVVDTPASSIVGEVGAAKYWAGRRPGVKPMFRLMKGR